MNIDQIHLAWDTLVLGSTLAAEKHWVTPLKADYWRDKLLYEDFHPGKHGGWRHGYVEPEIEPLLNVSILLYIHQHPECTHEELRQYLSDEVFQTEVSPYFYPSIILTPTDIKISNN